MVLIEINKYGINYSYLGEIKMRREAKLGAIFIVAVLLAMPVINSNAAEPEKKVPVTVSLINPLGGSTKQVMLSQKDAKSLEQQFEDATSALHVLMDGNSNDDEKAWAVKVVEKLMETLKEMGIVPEGFVLNIPAMFLNPKIAFLVPVVSVGRGFSFIPLYPGEAFIGFMLRPIFVQYFLLGYTASLHFNLVPPRLEYWDMVGTQTMVIWGFAGLYIDFGKIGYGIPRMQFIIGESLYVTGIDWM